MGVKKNFRQPETVKLVIFPLPELIVTGKAELQA